MATSPPKLNLIKVLFDSNRVIKAQHSHFLILSFIFILTPSLAAVVYNTLRSLFFATPNNFSSFTTTTLYGPLQDQPVFPTKTLLLTLAYGLFTSVFYLSAIGSITYSVIHGFHGQPLKLKATIKSISTSFFRLLGTNLLVLIIFFSITLVFLVLFVCLITGAKLMGFHINSSSPYFLLLFFSMMVALFVVLIYLQVSWSLSSVVVVAETTWGFTSLKRSWSLIKGRRWLALSLTFFFWLLSAVFDWITSYSPLVVGLDHDRVGSSDELKWLILPLAVQAWAFSTVQTMISLYEMVANAILYLYCNNVVVGDGYISLAVDDDEKVSGVVYIFALLQQTFDFHIYR